MGYGLERKVKERIGKRGKGAKKKEWKEKRKRRKLCLDAQR
jgi:hypothetical protein